ncbi:MTH938/NDUFAF3 family protein [candidate division KSB1 bacterium]
MSTGEIQDYQFGKMTVNGELHTKDLILLPDRIEGNWWRKEGHSLHVDDLTAVFQAQPDVLVVGIGAYGKMRIPEETRKALVAANIEIEAAKTDEACKRFNTLRENIKTAGAFHLTC